jgi:hypothetical protein
MTLFSEIDARVRAAVELVAGSDPSPNDPFRGLYVSDDLARALSRHGADSEFDDRLLEGCERLGLSALERSVLAVCAAPELSPHYGRLYAYLHDDVTRKLPSPRLVGRLLAGGEVSVAEVLRTFARAAPLRATGAIALVEGAEPTPLAERGVRVADALAAFLLGAELDDPQDDGSRRRVDVSLLPPGREPVVEQLRRLLGSPRHLPVVVAGPDAATILAAALGRPLLVVDARAVAAAEGRREAAITAALEGRALVYRAPDSGEPEELDRVVGALLGRQEAAVICADSAAVMPALLDAGALVIDVPPPGLEERRAAWASLSDSDEVDDVAAKFRLSVAQIAEAAEIAGLAAHARGNGVPGRADLDLGARRASSSRLGELATHLDARYGWSDLVLPERQQQMLGSISAYLRHRELVLSDWGFEQVAGAGQGLKVLFAGESGTGKTMSAQVIAADLGLDLFRIDLATTVSKYIGETEKNLDRIFRAADGSNAILFFDEADALFGKRSEVHASHDRYANIEVAYLLQRMEAHEGAVILATNFRQNIDDAFLRRLDIVIDFPFPEASDRRRIWQVLLPDAAPLADDVDIAFLADRFKLSGGSIRNAALAAAFLAAEEGGPIAMRHLVRGIALEYGKLGRLTLEAEFEQFHDIVRSGRRDGIDRIRTADELRRGGAES